MELSLGRIALVLFTAFLGTDLSAEPRLILTPPLRDRLKQAIQKPGTHRDIFHLLKAQTDSDAGWFNPQSANWNYGRAYRATSAAMLYQLTGSKPYCELTHSLLRDIYDKPDPDRRLPNEGYGLGRATVGLGFAFGYDWCRDAWTPEQRGWVEARIREALQAWLEYRHANLEAEHRGSNWVSVCRGGELMLLLSIALPDNHNGASRPAIPPAFAARYASLKDDLRRHMTNFDELGVSQEGIGYTAYGGIFLMRALLALRSIGDTDLEAEAAKHAWWKQAMYSGAFSKHPNRLFLMSGVGGPGIGDEGWTSLLIPFVPRANLPHYLFWYDRHIGALSPEPRFEAHRDGRVWALLAYPLNVKPADPTPSFPKAVSGSQGLTFFRNRWRDSDDIQVSLHADTTWHSHAWDQPEALQLGLITAGTVFIGGPNKVREPEKYSKPLIDGRVTTGARGPYGTGELESFEPGPAGGSVTALGGRQYAALQVKISRNLQVGFSNDGSALLLVTDDVNAGEEHTIRWQVRTSAAQGTPGRLLAGDRPVEVLLLPLSPAGASLSGSLPGTLSFDTRSRLTRLATAIWIGRPGAPNHRTSASGVVRLEAGHWVASVPPVGKPTLQRRKP